MNELKTFAKFLADESAKIITPYFKTKIAVDSKADNSPVTIADKKAEEKMRELIMKEFPAHGIIGEEFGKHQPEAEYVWVLDPIDGTKSFICGSITFGTLIGLMKNHFPVIGVINQPILKEFLIGDNSVSLLNGEKVSFRKVAKLSDAVLCTTDHLNIEKYKNRNGFEELIRKVKLYRQWGDCYGYLLAASGFADIMIDPIMSVWDTMALIPIIKGAGGIITDYEGNDVLKSNSTVAASKELHPLVIDILNGRK